jgi:hypothetical protein
MSTTSGVRAATAVFKILANVFFRRSRKTKDEKKEEVKFNGRPFSPQLIFHYYALMTKYLQ